MIVGADNLLKWFVDQDRPYYTVYNGKTPNASGHATTNKSNENETMDSARSRLASFLHTVSTGTFYIVCHDESKASAKGRSEIAFTINYSTVPAVSAVPISGMPGSGYVTKEEAQHLAEERFLKLMQKKELEDTKAKLTELEKEKRELEKKTSAPWQQFIGAIAPYTNSIMQGLGFRPNMPAVTGVPEVQQAGEVPGDDQLTDGQQVIQSFTHALIATFPDDWAGILQKLTKTLNENPDKIKMALNFL